jgi:transposase InsO family protein
VNHKKVLRITRKLGILCNKYTRKSRKYNSYRKNAGNQVKNRIRQRFDTPIPLQKIATDTSEFIYYEKNDKGSFEIKKLYLDPFLDMFNDEILAFGIAKTPNKNTILKALDETIVITKNCKYRTTIHSDGGWPYKMKEYKKRLKDNKIFQSMSRKATSVDNSVMENFFGLMKQEMYYGRIFTSYEELYDEIVEYIRYYNYKRIKEKLGWLSPVEYRMGVIG